MVQKLKTYLGDHPQQYELLRYVVAGGLTTVLSMLISYGSCFLLADKEPMTGSLIPWIVAAINRATAFQVALSNAVSWVIAVLFAFWINRRMVFLIKGGEKRQIARELVEFALGRVLSFLIFEEGMAFLLIALGMSNILNRVVVLVFVMIFNYIVSKFVVFKDKK